jgi:hypothetical protein
VEHLPRGWSCFNFNVTRGVTNEKMEHLPRGWYCFNFNVTRGVTNEKWNTCRAIGPALISMSRVA